MASRSPDFNPLDFFVWETVIISKSDISMEICNQRFVCTSPLIRTRHEVLQLNPDTRYDLNGLQGLI
jgi:hypothetical protein